MQIPRPGDTPPPLFTPARRELREQASSDAVLEEPQPDSQVEETRLTGDLGRDQEQKFLQTRTKERIRMQIILIVGVLVSFAAIAGIIKSMSTGTQTNGIRETSPPQEVSQKIALSPATQSREQSVLSMAESLAKTFLEGSTVDEVLSTVRNPKVAEARMREYYPSGKIPAIGLVKFNSAEEIITKGDQLAVSVITKDQGERTLGFVKTPDGLKIDWESWVGWSELPWEKFLATKPSTGHVFRVILSPVDYYNFGFSDEDKWQSYRLESPTRSHGLYGYANQDTELRKHLRLNADQKEILLTLSLKFPPNSDSNSQVEIDKFICEGWVEKGESP